PPESNEFPVMHYGFYANLIFLILALTHRLPPCRRVCLLVLSLRIPTFQKRGTGKLAFRI
ncbi:MAG: hypothetical protein IJU92_06140, partial [Spirochaetaceae bacterium]|nr:hypothetical protein [Spirochaetaceae bacterium]